MMRLMHTDPIPTAGPDDAGSPAPPGGFDWQGRHRPLLFLGGHGVYLVLVTIFPLVLPFVIRNGGDFSRLMVQVNWIVLLMEGFNLGLGRGLQQLAIQTDPARLGTVLARPLKGALVTGAVLLVAMSAIVPLLYGWHPAWFENRPLIAALVWLTAALGLVRTCTQGLLFGSRAYPWFLGLDVGWAAARLMLVPLAWWLGGLAAALAAMALLWVATLVPAFPVLARRGLRIGRVPMRAGLASITYYLRFGFWLQAASLAAGLVRPLAVLAIATAVGHSARTPHAAPGFAHLALSIFVIGAMLLEATLMSHYPEKAAAGRAGLGAALARRADEEARALLYLLMPLAWAGWHWGPALARIWPESFHALGPWLAIMLLALPARAMATPHLLALQASHRPATATAWQAARLVIVMAGLGVGLWGWKGNLLAALWGIVAGEWLVTLALVWFTGSKRSHAANSGVWLIGLAAMATLAQCLGMAGLGSLGWWVVGGVAWYGVLPLTPLVHVRDLRHLLTPREID